MSTSQQIDERVLVLAPIGRDASLTCALLERAGLTAQSCANIADVCDRLREGAGVLMLAEEVLVPEAIRRLASLLALQEPWSDLPILLFSGTEATVQTRAPTLRMLEPLGNVVLLDRPVRPTTMLTAIRTALRARGRQYEAREALRAEQRAVRERDKFLAMLGHELRNPLSPIFVALELLDGRGTDAVAARSLAVMRRQVRHLSRIVDDLLDVSRVTSGKVVLQRAPLDLVELVAQCVQSFEGAASSQCLTLSFQRPKGVLMVDGDAVRLEQVVTNLALNAIKYTPPGGHVNVSLAEEDGAAVVRFRDDGAGIPEDVLPRVFELFVQAEQTLDRAKGGMGVGLTLVKSLVELHGGAVEAFSEGLGSGSEFVVRLPSSQSEACRASPASSKRERPRARHILVVEDNEDAREMLRCLLEELGHRVDCAEDGPTGVSTALAVKPEVLIVDIGLPGMDGYGVARHVRDALGKEVLLVALTGYGQPDDRRLAGEAGFDQHLTKPVALESLERLLRRHDAPAASASS